MKKSTKLLITGATGDTGGYAIDELLKTSVSIRALVHQEDERANLLRQKGIEVFVGNLLNLDDVTAALEGITNAYFVFPIQIPGILTATSYFIQAGKESGLQSIVNMSQISARRQAKSHAAQDHWVSERIFDYSGIPVTHLRPTFFAEWLVYRSLNILKSGTISMPFGEVKHAPIAAEDIGRVIAKILLAPETFEGKTFSLYGQTEYSYSEIVQFLSSSIGRKIEYRSIPIEAFQDAMVAQGSPAHFVQHIVSVARDFLDGQFSGNNDNMEIITGVKPLDIRDFIEKNKHFYLHEISKHP
jgi:NAD(P)H dehydrogenase (quinone)